MHTLILIRGLVPDTRLIPLVTWLFVFWRSTNQGYWGGRWNTVHIINIYNDNEKKSVSIVKEYSTTRVLYSWPQGTLSAAMSSLQQYCSTGLRCRGRKCRWRFLPSRVAVNDNVPATECGGQQLTAPRTFSNISCRHYPLEQLVKHDLWHVFKDQAEKLF